MNKTIAFHSNQLGMRGTEVALYDYAHYNETILHNRSVIISDGTGDLVSYEKFKDRFKVYLYTDFLEVESIVEHEKIDAVYYIKAGGNDGKLVSNARNCVHAVFPSTDVHGDVYAYISQWLADFCNADVQNAVPHIVTLPDVQKDLREEFDLPAEATVFGRYGGYDTFDMEPVREAVIEVAKQRPDIYFLFMNTPHFCKLPNVLFFRATSDGVKKTKFINTCDAMIYGRKQGETFGLAIAEFLHQDKPVIAHPFGEKNHVAMMLNHGIWYRTKEELLELLLNFKRTEPIGTYSNLVKRYAPEPVMRRFEEVFLKGL